MDFIGYTNSIAVSASMIDSNHWTLQIPIESAAFNSDFAHLFMLGLVTGLFVRWIKRFIKFIFGKFSSRTFND